jgi:hypothetical protein
MIDRFTVRGGAVGGLLDFRGAVGDRPDKPRIFVGVEG